MSLPEEIFEVQQQRIDIAIVRGDTLSLKLFQASNEDDTPYNLTGYQFGMQVRPAPKAKKVIIEALNSNFILGQSAVAIDYDTIQGNLGGTTKDEVILTISAEDTRVTAHDWYYDIEVIDTGGDVQTPIYGDFKIIQDVTRINE